MTLYQGEDRFAAATAPFVVAALDRGSPVMVAVPRRQRELLRRELGRSGDRVQFLEMEVVGKNPGRIISLWQRFVESSADAASGPRGVGQAVWADRGPAELEECGRHEALMNRAFAAEQDFHLLCPYDTLSLDGATIERARAQHPPVGGSMAGTWSARRITTPDATALRGTLSDPPEWARLREFDATDVHELRGILWWWAREVGLDRSRAADLVFACNEVATNSVRHGGGHGIVRLWLEVGSVVCEVRDAGVMTEPLVGRMLPPASYTGGRGLWMVHRLCDLVQMRSDVAHGTTIRLWMDRPGPRST